MKAGNDIDNEQYDEVRFGLEMVSFYRKDAFREVF